MVANSCIGCIEPYKVEDKISLQPRLVIDGTITDNCCDRQEIIISQTSSTEDLEFKPYSACEVRVNDNAGKSWSFAEDDSLPGHYYGYIDQESLIVGSRFQLLVVTPDGRQYRSTLETMQPCPPIDTIYHSYLQKPTTDPEKFITGHQFYTNFKASDYFGNYYRYVIIETYEYHSTWPKNDYIDENNIRINGRVDYSTFICYQTDTVDQITTLSTEAFSSNEYEGFKLHFVDNHSQRLMWHYSALLKLQSLNQNAYEYWEKLKQNNKSEGGLFTKQPALIRGNMRNVTDSTEIVLGYFSVVSESTKRIVLGRVNDLTYYQVGLCKAHIIENGALFPDEPRPLYLLNAWNSEGEIRPAWAEIECFDCTLLGGVLEEPEFFKEQK